MGRRPKRRCGLASSRTLSGATGEPASVRGIANVQDDAWAGYVSETRGAPSSVSATLTVNNITGYPGDRAVSWVGLGGADAERWLIQAGIDYRMYSGGWKSANFWWEIVPGYQIQDVNNSVGMTWGDKVNVTVRFAMAHAYFTLYDYRTNKAMTIIKYWADPPSRSAECVSERVTTGTNRWAPLADFGAQRYYGCTYQLAGSTRPYSVAQMGLPWSAIRNGVTYMTASSYSGAYGDFTVTWRHR